MGIVNRFVMVSYQVAKPINFSNLYTSVIHLAQPILHYLNEQTTPRNLANYISIARLPPMEVRLAPRNAIVY